MATSKRVADALLANDNDAFAYLAAKTLEAAMTTHAIESRATLTPYAPIEVPLALNQDFCQHWNSLLCRGFSEQDDVDRAATACRDVFHHACSASFATEHDSEHNKHQNELNVTMAMLIEWLFWMTVLDSGRPLPSVWLRKTLNKRDRTKLRRLLDVAARSMVRGYQLLGLTVPEEFESKVYAGAVVISPVMPKLSTIDGHVAFQDRYILVQSAASGPGTMAVLYSGAHRSQLDEAVLFAIWPKAELKPYPAQWECCCAGGGVVKERRYSVLDILFASTINGRPVFVKITHQFDVVKEQRIVPMLVGQDLMHHHGFNINVTEKLVVITSCNNAQVPIHSNTMYFAQVEGVTLPETASELGNSS